MPVITAPRTYESSPPVIRERIPTLDLEDDDIVEAPAPAKRVSTPPPPPLARRSSAPPPESTVKPKIPGPAPLPADVAPVEPVLVPVVVEDAAPVAVAAPAPVAEAPAPAPVAIPAPVVAAAPPPVAAAPAPPPAPVSVLRASAPDPTDVLFDAMYELNFAGSAWEAAGVCASMLAKALGARAVVIHAHDLARRELRAIGAHGEADVDVIGLSEPSDDDLVASAVICNQNAVTMRFDGELPRLAPRRLRAVGAPRTLVAVPAMAWGRCLGIIEVIDADERFAARVADSAAYVADRFAEYLCANAA